MLGVLIVAVETTQVTQRLQSLSELTAALSGTLTLDDVARVALRYAGSSFDADQVAFGVDDGPRLADGPPGPRRAAGRGRRAAAAAVAPQPGDSPAPLAATAAAGRAAVRVGRAAAVGHRDGPARPERIRALAALPLRTPSLRGALAVGYREPAPLVARRAGAAGRRGRAGRAGRRAGPPVRDPARHRPAAAAQHAARSTCPTCPGCGWPPATTRASTATRPAATSTTRSCCPTASSAVVLGDVAGHDVQAAAVMGQVRAALRALALTDPRARPPCSPAWTGWSPAWAPRRGTRRALRDRGVRGDRRRTAAG